MAFKDETLEFFDSKIVNSDGAEVMMDWEAPIMEKSAEFICHNKGDILNKSKNGAKITYWNNFDSENNEHSFDSISFESISISPDSNTYMNGNTYYMPKVEL